MRYLISLTVLVIAQSASANGFDRPIPQAQSATAEIWFAFASLALIVALWAVHKLVTRA